MAREGGTHTSVYVVSKSAPLVQNTTVLLRGGGYGVHVFDSHLEVINLFNTRRRSSRASCLLLDMEGPNRQALQDARVTTAMPVVCVGEPGHVDMIREAIRGGAVDYLEKPLLGPTLISAIDAAIHRRSPGSRATNGEKLTLDEIFEALPPLEEAITLDELHRRFDLLTPRECDVLRRILKSASAKMIARDLGISSKTVEHMWSNILRKMQMRNAEALRTLINAARRVRAHLKTP